MKRIRFGDLCIDKGNYTLYAVRGADAGNVNKNEMVYIDTDGSTDRDIYFQPRVIEVEGHLLADNITGYAKLKEILENACNPKITRDLYYFNGFKTYYAEARADQLPAITPINYCNAKFILYLKIEKFYWLSNNDINVNIFKREDKIKGTFQFPMIFTERTSKALVRNDGAAEVYPTFKIYLNDDQTEIKIKNNTSGQTLSLSVSMQQGETVTIDCEDKKITSDTQGDLTKWMSKDSQFISIAPGIEEIECISSGASVICIYRNKYLGA